MSHCHFKGWSYRNGFGHTGGHIDQNTNTPTNRGLVILTTLVRSLNLLKKNNVLFNIPPTSRAVIILLLNLKINMTNMTNMTRPDLTGFSVVISKKNNMTRGDHRNQKHLKISELAGHPPGLAEGVEEQHGMIDATWTVSPGSRYKPRPFPGPGYSKDRCTYYIKPGKERQMTIIYEPKGRAREYAKLAANLYNTCSHGCHYCFAPSTMKLKKEDFHSQNRIKNNAIKDLVKDARKFRGDNREILLSFMGDVYNPDEPNNGITRQAIKILIENDLRFTVLTKGGDRVRRDFDLFEGYPKCSIGQTIVFSKQADADTWEPNAAPLAERFSLAEDAHKAGIRTWVSLEPVIHPDQALDVVEKLYPVVDLWKVGPINYQKTEVDWKLFHDQVVGLLEKVSAKYILKNALLSLPDERCDFTLKSERKMP